MTSLFEVSSINVGGVTVVDETVLRTVEDGCVCPSSERVSVSSGIETPMTPSFPPY